MQKIFNKLSIFVLCAFTLNSMILEKASATKDFKDACDQLKNACLAMAHTYYVDEYLKKGNFSHPEREAQLKLLCDNNNPATTYCVEQVIDESRPARAKYIYNPKVAPYKDLLETCYGTEYNPGLCPCPTCFLNKKKK